ncbi:MAG: calcium:proton antiporter [Alphaproteobacteria bacterium]
MPATLPESSGLRSTSHLVRTEAAILLGLASGVAALAHWSPVGPSNGVANVAWTAWLVAAILACAFRAMSHADELAERLGEPIGTILLTISAITIEVAAVSAMMIGSRADNTIARDTMFSVLMLILNLLLGAAMVAGGLRRTEQEFNAQSTAAYLPLVIALATLTLILPRFTTSEEGGWMSDPMQAFVGVASLVIYGVFLAMQTTRHREFFAYHGHSERAADTDSLAESIGEGSSATHPSLGLTIALLVTSLVAVVAIAEGLAGRVRSLLHASGVPGAIGGVFIAALVLAPEGLAALRAARRDDMQRSVNILLGSALSTIGLTVPAVIAIAFLTGAEPELGLEPPYVVLLGSTLLIATVNLERGRTSAVQGVVHLLLFLAWIATILDEAAGKR